jgi:uncharacterized protein
MDSRGVVAYVAIAFGLAWLIEGVALVSGVRFASLTRGSTFLLAAVMVTPAIAAFVVRRFVTREGFATAGLRVGPWRPYVAVWLGVPVLMALVYAVTLVLGLGRFDPTLSQLMQRIHDFAQAEGQQVPALPPPPVFAAVLLIQSLTLGMIAGSIFTFGEEFGWTGYLLIRLLPLGKWRAAVIYGVIWGLWHVPIIAGGFNYPGYPVLGPAMMCLLTVALALTQTALRIRYDSVFLTSVFHAGVNTHGLSLLPMVVVGSSPILGGITGLVGITMFMGVGAWLLARTPETPGNSRTHVGSGFSRTSEKQSRFTAKVQ